MKIVLFDLGNTLETRGVLLPGALATLDAIQAMNDKQGNPVVLALCSDYRMPVPHDAVDQSDSIIQEYYELLKQLGIRSYLEPVKERVTLSTEVGVFKPDAKIFQAVITKIDLNQRFENVLFITENELHVEAAKALGMKTIHFRGPRQSSGQVTELVELVPLVKEFVGHIDLIK